LPAEQRSQQPGIEIIKILHSSPKMNLPSIKPPVLCSNSGAADSSERVAAVTLSLENCSCSQATYSRCQALIPNFRNVGSTCLEERNSNQ